MKPFKVLWPLLPSFAIFVACIYNLSYWNQFHINAFEFLTINQIALAAVKAFVWTPFFLVAGALIGSEMATETRSLEAQGKLTRAKLQDKLMNGLIVTSTVAGAYAFIIDNVWWPFLLGPGIAIFLGRWIAASRWIPVDIASPGAVYGVTFLTIFVAMSAHGRGMVEAKHIIEGTRYLAVTDDACAERFVGRAGDFLIFFQPKSQSIRLVSSAEPVNLSLNHKTNSKCSTF